MSKDHTKLLEAIRRLHVGHHFILGIDGLSRSGKTTFVEGLSATLHRSRRNVCMFHMDDYIVERKRRYHTGHAAWYEYYGLQWDVEYLRENLFTKAKQSDEVTLQFYNAELDDHFTKTISLPEECIIIIEGVFLQRPAWRDFLDYCVYLDCPRDARFAREGKDVQSKIEKFQKRYWMAEDHYLASVNPLARANMIIES